MIKKLVILFNVGYFVVTMAGRGRGATLPAWMTAGGGEVANGSLGVSSISNAQFEDSYLPATNTQNVYDSQQRTGVNVTDGRVGGRSREPRGVDRSLSRYLLEV